MAIGIPVFLLLLWAFPTAGLTAGPSLLLAILLSFITVESLERFAMTTPGRRRLIPLFFLGVLIAYLVVLPFLVWDDWGR